MERKTGDKESKENAVEELKQLLKKKKIQNDVLKKLMDKKDEDLTIIKNK